MKVIEINSNEIIRVGNLLNPKVINNKDIKPSNAWEKENDANIRE